MLFNCALFNCLLCRLCLVPPANQNRIRRHEVLVVAAPFVATAPPSHDRRRAVLGARGAAHPREASGRLRAHAPGRDQREPHAQRAARRRDALQGGGRGRAVRRQAAAAAPPPGERCAAAGAERRRARAQHPQQDAPAVGGQRAGQAVAQLPRRHDHGRDQEGLPGEPQAEAQQ